MGRFIKDLTGQRFGKLTVLSRAEKDKNGKSRWLCKCDCIDNSEVIVLDYLLKNGHVKSCGCAQYIVEDLTGQKFNKLTVISRAENRGKTIMWNCKCDCIEGNETIVQGNSLKSGHTKSCGCLHDVDDLTGQKFGELTVISRSEIENGRSRWKCKCSCTEYCVVEHRHLICGYSKSCGHLRKLIGKDNKTWRGCGEITGSYFSSIRFSAKNRGIEFNLTIEFLWELFLKQDRKCVLSGINLFFYISKKYTHTQTASLDRIDSNKGYTEDNVQWVHKDLNIFKKSLSDEEFIKWCHMISSNDKSIKNNTIYMEFESNKIIKEDTEYISENSKSSDLTGRKFGNLMVLSKVENNEGLSGWLCKCSCDDNNEVIVYSNNLISGHTKSCGCKHYPINKNSKKWKGCGEISGEYFSSIRSNAKSKGRKFDISVEYIWELFIRQDKKCALSGCDLIFGIKNSNKYIKTASLDRIDSSKGYIKGNVQWVHKEINIMKQEFTDKYFIEMCTIVSNNNPTKNISSLKVA